VFEVSLRDNAVLRPLEPWQADEFAANLDRCREHIRPWVGESFVAADATQAREVLQRYADGQARDDNRIFGIWLDGGLVGGVMFVRFSAKQGICEVGCWLEPSAQGNGLITSAVRVLIDWAFTVRGLHRVEWWTKEANTPSIKVAKRLGMTLDGTLRGYFADGTGEQVWSVLASEWQHNVQ
jgi:ribosomal-protein-serine acetyltransferase